MAVAEESKIVNVTTTRNLELNQRQDKTLKISYTPEMQNLLTAIENKQEIVALEINCIGIRPDFLIHDSFYNAIENANNLFLVDVISADGDINSIADIIDKLKNSVKQLIIQCRSPTGTKVYVKEFSLEIMQMNLILPTKLVTSSDELILTEKIFIEKLCDKNTFALPLVIEALRSEFVGHFDAHPPYHQSLTAVTFYTDITFAEWKLIDYAVFHDNFLVVRLLSMHDWNLRIPNGSGQRTLEIAAEFAGTSTLAALLNLRLPLSNEKIIIPDDKFDLLELPNNEGNTPLLIAASKGRKDNVVFFLKCGADVRHHNCFKESATDLAWNNKHNDIVLMLLEADAELPKGFAFEENDDEALHSFFKNREVLHTSIKEGNLQEVKEFVSVSKSKFYLNVEGKSALLAAIESKQYDVYAFLLSKGVIFKDGKEQKIMDNLDGSQKYKLQEKLIPVFPQIDSAHILYLVSKSRCKESIGHFEEYVKTLYEQLDKIPEISTILKVIQYSSYVDIIFDLNKDSVKDIYPTEGSTTKGLCDYNAGRLYIGAENDNADFLGTLAHELTHFAMQIIYGNNCRPYYRSSIEKESEFKTITADMEGICTSSSPSVDDVIKRVFTVYNDSCWSAELIVRIPHMLAKYGEGEGKKLLGRQAGKLLEYYTDNVMPDCDIFIQQSFLIKLKNNIKSLNEYSGIIRNIEELKIAFQETINLENFLQLENTKMLLLNTESTLLSCINVYQSLQKIPPYSSPNSSLFFGLDSYLKQYSAVNKAFYSEASNLLVIEYNVDLGDKSLTPTLITLIGIIRAKPNKKVIFITQEAYVSDFKERLATAVGDRGYSNYLMEVNDRKFTLDDFTPDAQNKLLMKQVVFQGDKRRFCTFVGEDMCNLTRTFKKIIDSETLVKLIGNEDIKINNELIRLGDIDAAYSKVYEVIEPGHLVDILLAKDRPYLLFPTRPLFMISTSKRSSSEAIKDKLVRNLGLYERKMYSPKESSDVKDRMTLFLKEMDRKQILIDASKQGHSENFKLLCHSYPKKVIYWIDWEDGKFIWQQLYNPDLYVARRFKYQEKIVMRDDMQEMLELGSSNFFIIVSNEEKHNACWYDTRLRELSEKLREAADQYHDWFTFTSDENAEIKFQELCKKGKPTHWLEFDGTDFIWQRSNGSLEKIERYMDKQKCQIITLNEDHFVDRLKDKEAIIIIDEPGMGKSTALTKISEMKLGSHWPIRINLRDCREAISALDSDNITTEMAVQFLVKTGNFDLNTDLVVARTILGYKLSCARDSLPLLLLFDGFDEIKGVGEEGKRNVASLLKFLKGKAAVWVTARKHERDILQNSLSIFKTEFEEFTQTEQKEFLKKFWMSRFSLMSCQKELFEIFGLGTNKPNNKFEQYTKKLFQSTDEIFERNISDFIGVPLRLRLFSAGFEEKFKIFIYSSDNNTPEFDNLDILRIYEYFVHSTYNIYIKEKTAMSKGFSEVSKRWFTDSLTEIHCRLAFAKLFEYKAKYFIVGKPPFLEEDGVITLDGKQLTELCRIGIVQSVKRGHFEFTHKTFAEYFVALLLFNCIKGKIRNPSKYEATIQFLLERMLLTYDNEVIFNFLDCMLSRDSPLHTATLNSNLDEVNRLINSNADISFTDKLERTALHLAAQKGDIDIVESLLEADCDTSRKPDALGRIPLHYASRYGNTEVIQCLANKNRDTDREYSIYWNPFEIDAHLGFIIFRGYSQSKLIKFINYEDKSNRAPLYCARHDIVGRQLLEYGCEVNVLRDLGRLITLKEADPAQMEFITYKAWLQALLLAQTKARSTEIVKLKTLAHVFLLTFCCYDGHFQMAVVFDLICDCLSSSHEAWRREWQWLSLRSSRGVWQSRWCRIQDYLESRLVLRIATSVFRMLVHVAFSVPFFFRVFQTN